MRILRSLIYILSVLLLQTIILQRLSFFNALPDLVLISVIIFSITYERGTALPLCLLAAFLQDILSGGPYINLLIKGLACLATETIKENFIGSREHLALGLVLIFTPLTLLLAGGIFCFSGRHISLYPFLLTVIFSTFYNLILTPAVLWAINKIKI